jgi:thiol-disulfide isomerase/thioredoxin
MVLLLKPVANPSLARRRLLQAGLAGGTGLLPAAAAVSRRPSSATRCSTAAPAAASGRLRGKVLLVNFWATSCAVCVQEMPQIVATHEHLPAARFDTLAVAMSHDPPAYVAHFAETRRLPFGVVIDNTGAIAMPGVTSRSRPPPS